MLKNVQGVEECPTKHSAGQSWKDSYHVGLNPSSSLHGYFGAHTSHSISSQLDGGDAVEAEAAVELQRTRQAADQVRGLDFAAPWWAQCIFNARSPRVDWITVWSCL